MGKCILIFDDDPEILAVCKIILEQCLYLVVTRPICDNIIKDISQVKPDIILMDLWIPTIGGESAINLMKNNSATQHIPFVLFSANGEIDIIANRLNAAGFLKKPFEINSLLDIIKANIPVLI
jgi:DNA-binding NtrC family response regulator